jgi:beta-glucanase (GH16 family)
MTWGDEFTTLDPARWQQFHWEWPKTPQNLYVRDGILHLVSRRSEGYLNTSLTTLDPTDNVPNKTFKYGYFEARTKVPQGKGGWPAWFLNSEAQQRGNPCLYLWGEIDIYEQFGSWPHTHFLKLHKNTGSGCGVPDETRPTSDWMRCDTATTSCDLGADWHTWGLLWEPGRVRWYRDGQIVQSTRYHSTVADVPAYDSTNQSMVMVFDMYIGGWNNPVDATSPDVFDHQVDWVRVWTR